MNNLSDVIKHPDFAEEFDTFIRSFILSKETDRSDKRMDEVNEIGYEISQEIIKKIS